MVMRIDTLRGGGTVALVSDAVASEHLSHRVRHGQVWWRAARRASALAGIPAGVGVWRRSQTCAFLRANGWKRMGAHRQDQAEPC